MKNNDHISNEEIEQDITDTKAEIIDMERKIKGYELIGDKMSIFRADGMRGGIRERQIFIEKLTQLLLSRNLPPK